MKRRRFTEMGELMAASESQLEAFAGRPQALKARNPGNSMDDTYDGTALSPKE